MIRDTPAIARSIVVCVSDVALVVCLCMFCRLLDWAEKGNQAERLAFRYKFAISNIIANLATRCWMLLSSSRTEFTVSESSYLLVQFFLSVCLFVQTIRLFIPSLLISSFLSSFVLSREPSSKSHCYLLP